MEENKRYKIITKILSIFVLGLNLVMFSEIVLAQTNNQTVTQDSNILSSTVRHVIIFGGFIYIFIAINISKYLGKNNNINNIGSNNQNNINDQANDIDPKHDVNNSDNNSENISPQHKKMVDTINHVTNSPGFKNIRDLIGAFGNNNRHGGNFNRNYSDIGSDWNNNSIRDGRGKKLNPLQTKISYSIIIVTIVVIITVITS